MVISRREYVKYFDQYGGGELPFSMSIGCGRPRVIICGATHGNEPVGVVAAVKAHRALQDSSLDGQITFLLSNPQAYIMDQRYIDYDLNRSFVNGVSGGIEARRAKEIEHFLRIERPDGLLDLHSVSQGNTKMVAYDRANANNGRLASKISECRLQFSYRKEHLSGLLVDFVSALGSQAVAVECGNHTSPDAFDTAWAHLTNFLIYFGLIEGTLPTRQGSVIYSTLAKIVPGPGFRFLNGAQSEMKIRAGEVFAHDQRVGYHSAPMDCYLMLPSKNSKETDNDAGFLCSKRIG